MTIPTKRPRRSAAVTRRRFLAGAGGLFVLGLAGCGGAGGGSGGGSSSSGGARYIEHRFGTTEISGVPERVVSVGYTDHDFAIALGTVPVGMGRWIEDRAIWPWNRDDIGGEQPETFIAGEPNFEQIAALEPDLILGLSAGMPRETYDTLSEIAPTIERGDEYVDFGVPWQEMTRVIGRAMNREARTDDLVSGLEARFGKARKQHPEFEGKSVVIALPGESGTYYPYASDDPRSRFMTALGFEIPPRMDELAGDNFYATISTEELTFWRPISSSGWCRPGSRRRP